METFLWVTIGVPVSSLFPYRIDYCFIISIILFVSPTRGVCVHHLKPLILRVQTEQFSPPVAAAEAESLTRSG